MRALALAEQDDALTGRDLHKIGSAVAPSRSSFFAADPTGGFFFG